MSGSEGRWCEHPDAVGDAERPLVDDELELASSVRVVGLGAICDLRARGLDDPHSQSFSVSEFVLLESGRRVILHDDRGFTIGSGAGAVRDYETRDTITRNVLNVVLPDDDDCHDDHPWSWLAEMARARGLEVTAGDLERLPYEVIFTDGVTEWLARS